MEKHFQTALTLLSTYKSNMFRWKWSIIIRDFTETGEGSHCTIGRLNHHTNVRILPPKTVGWRTSLFFDPFPCIYHICFIFTHIRHILYILPPSPIRGCELLFITTSPGPSPPWSCIHNICSLMLCLLYFYISHTEQVSDCCRYPIFPNSHFIHMVYVAISNHCG